MGALGQGEQSKIGRQKINKEGRGYICVKPEVQGLSTLNTRQGGRMARGLGESGIRPGRGR